MPTAFAPLHGPATARSPDAWQWPDAPAQAEFGNATHLGNMARTDEELCRHVAQGGAFGVGGGQFRIAWDRSYARFEVICVGEGPDFILGGQPISKLKKSIAAQLDTRALRDAMTYRIDATRLGRGEIHPETRDELREHWLVSVEDADKSLTFAVQPDEFGHPSWRPIDTNRQSIFHRFRLLLLRVFCPWVPRAAKAEQDEWQRKLNISLSCGQDRREVEWPSRPILGQPATEPAMGMQRFALPLPEVGLRDEEAVSALQQARQQIERRWPSLVVLTPLAAQVLLWHPDLDFAKASELAAAWDGLLVADPGADVIQLDEQPVVANSFTDLLARLGESAEFKQAHECLVSRGKPTLDVDRQKMDRVQATLRAIHDDAAIRELCFAIADEGLHQCGDRVALCFSTIEAECLVHGLQREDHGAGLKEQLRGRVELAVRMFRQATFDALSARYLLGLPAHEDAIEHRLILQQRCQQHGVIFPVAMGRIRYFVKVPDSAVMTIVNGIRAAERNVEALATYVAGQGFWQRFMERYDPKRFHTACADLDADRRALGAHDMQRAGMELEPDDHAAMAARDVNHFYRRYPEIANLASAPELTEEQFTLIRSQIAASRGEKVRDVCRQLTAEVLHAQNS